MPYLTDPIGDLLTRMRNAQSVRHQKCRAPWSRIKQELCEILKREGFLDMVEVVGEGTKRELEVTFVPGKTVSFQRESTPGRRQYRKATELKPVLRGYGTAILTTSQGLLTDSEARAKKIGGEVLCTIA